MPPSSRRPKDGGRQECARDTKACRASSKMLYERREEWSPAEKQGGEEEEEEAVYEACARRPDIRSSS